MAVERGRALNPVNFAEKSEVSRVDNLPPRDPPLRFRAQGLGRVEHHDRNALHTRDTRLPMAHVFALRLEDAPAQRSDG